MPFEPPRRKRRRPGLTPLIDVVFLLLVFFMLATSFGAEGSLPLRVGTQTATDRQDEAGDIDAEPEAIRIVLSAEGHVRVDGGPVRKDELSTAVARALANDRNRPVRVLSHADSELQAIVTVLAELERAGAGNVELVLASAAQPGDPAAGRAGKHR